MRLGLPALLLPLLVLGAPSASLARAGVVEGAVQGLTLLFQIAPGVGPGGGFASEIREAALADLRESGVFPQVEETSATTAAFLKGPKGSGSGLLLRMTTRSGPAQNCLLEAVCLVSGSDRVVWSRAFRGPVAALRRMVHRAVDDLVADVTGVPGAADSAFVYSMDSFPGVREIHALARDGSGAHPLTSFRSLTDFPALSRDGRLAVVSYKAGPPRLWYQKDRKGPLVPLPTPASGLGLGIRDLAWSPDGTVLLFVQENRKGLSGIHAFRPLSGSISVLTPGDHLDRCPAWSPDGRAIAFLSDRDGPSQVFIVDAEGGHPRPLTRDRLPKDAVAWSPQGDRIAFSSRSAGQSLLTLSAPDGSGARDLVSVPGRIGTIQWSPDGRSLLLEVQEGSQWRHLVAGLDGKLRPAGALPRRARSVRWVRSSPR